MFTFSRRCSRLLMGTLVISALAMVLSISALAQTITGSIAGTVTDSSNRVIVGATVTLLGEQTGSKRDLTTGEDVDLVSRPFNPGSIP